MSENILSALYNHSISPFSKTFSTGYTKQQKIVLYHSLFGGIN